MNFHFSFLHTSSNIMISNFDMLGATVECCVLDYINSLFIVHINPYWFESKSSQLSNHFTDDLNRMCFSS